MPYYDEDDYVNDEDDDYDDDDDDINILIISPYPQTNL